jgi:hypothetical protein
MVCRTTALYNDPVIALCDPASGPIGGHALADPFEMRSLTVLLCLVAGITCIWLEYLKPYQPREGSPALLERFRSLSCLSLSGTSLACAFVFLFCDMEWTLKSWIRLLGLATALGLNGLAATINYDVPPFRPAPVPLADEPPGGAPSASQ